MDSCNAVLPVLDLRPGMPAGYPNGESLPKWEIVPFTFYILFSCLLILKFDKHSEEEGPNCSIGA